MTRARPTPWATPDIARAMQVSVHTVQTWTKRDDFPKPLGKVTSREIRVWDADEIRDWRREKIRERRERRKF